MKIKLSSKNTPIIAITGHAGCGHCHSHKQYVQDDSGGLAVALSILSEATDLSLIISDVKVVTGAQGYFEITTVSGGTAKSSPRRGITPYEAKLAYTVLGQEAICTQSLALSAFGRVYGQGAGETAVALQIAIANAAIDSFHKNFPDKFVYGREELDGNCGTYTGAIIDIDGIAVAVMALANASEGGLGPNEDLEGNCYGKGKYKGMKKLGMIDCPTIIIEGKVYTPMYCDELKEETFLVRYDEEIDNKFVAHALYESAKTLGHTSIINEKLLKRVKGALKQATEDIGERIVDLGNRLKKAQSSYEKVQIVAELNQLASEDCGGVTFMSNDLHEIIAGVGGMPYTSAVISLLVTKEHRDKVIMPYMDSRDVDRFKEIILNSIPSLEKTLTSVENDIKISPYNGEIDKYIKTKLQND